MKISSSLFGIFTLAILLTFTHFTVQATQVCDFDSPAGVCTTQKDDRCDYARKIGMAQGCTTSGGTGHSVSTTKISELTMCEDAMRRGIAQGCSTSGGTGTSITYNAADGSLGTCRQSYRAGQANPIGCSDQTPVRDVIPK